MEGALKLGFARRFTDFGKGFFTGFLIAAVIFSFAAGFVYRRSKFEEGIEYAKKREAVQAVIEDYASRDACEFVDSVPGVRTAAEGAADDFQRRRDEILERFRSGLAD